jgi:exodeoxyribonuclease V
MRFGNSFAREKSLSNKRLTKLKKSDLSPDQLEAYSGILSWLKRGTETKPTLTFAGFAGSGKTTVISVLARDLPQPLAFCTFAGKASSVLRRKLRDQGIETTAYPENEDLAQDPRPYCGTIHGLIYRPCPECSPKEEARGHTSTGNCRSIKTDTCEDHGLPRERCSFCERCPACDPPPPRRRASGKCLFCGGYRFVRRTKLDRPYKLIVMDEASMVSDELLKDLLRYNVPILAIGDHGQLKPVKGDGSLMLRPDIRLEKIHRQAESNPIIALSKFVRETGNIDPRFADGKHVFIQFKHSGDGIDQDRNLSALIQRNFQSGRNDFLSIAIITATNKRRVAINQEIRAILGRDRMPPCEGDIVVCLKNRPPIYNGMRGVIASEVEFDDDRKRPKYTANVDFPDDETMCEASMSGHQFGLAKPSPIDREWADEHEVSPLASLGDLYDYGYAMTCHKMQGSQVERAVVVYERGLHRWMPGDGEQRWLYTAITRSSDKLVIFR